jgi:hypothetical protein
MWKAIGEDAAGEEVLYLLEYTLSSDDVIKSGGVIR